MDFWCYLWPLYGIAKCLLIHPVGIAWKSGEAGVSILGTMYSLTLAIGYYVYHVMMAKRQLSFIEKDYNFVTNAIDSYNLFSGCTFFLLIVVTATFNQRGLIEVLMGIYTFDERMQKMHLAVDNRRWAKTVYSPGLVGFCALGVMEYANCIMFIRNTMAFSDYCLIMCYIPMFVLVVSQWMFIAYCLAIEGRFKVIKDHLKSLPEGDFLSQSTAEDMKCPTEMLVRATKTLNCIFSFPLLLLLLNQFTAMATLLYDLCMCIVESDEFNMGKDIVNTSGWSVLFLLEMLAVCRVCQTLEEEAQETTRQLVRLSGHGCLRQMELLTAFRVKITACQLFSVDMKLFYAMFGAIATYLIVLVQFDIAQDD